MENEILHQTSASFDLEEGGHEYLLAFSNLLLEDGRYTKEIVFDGLWRARTSDYLQLPRLNQAEWVVRDQDVVDEMVEFANSVLSDLKYRKRVEYLDGQFRLFSLPRENPIAGADANPVVAGADANPVVAVAVGDVNPVAGGDVNPVAVVAVADLNPHVNPLPNLYLRSAIISYILICLIEHPATKDNMISMGALEASVLQKLETRGVDVNPLKGFLTADFMSSYITPINTLLNDPSSDIRFNGVKTQVVVSGEYCYVLARP